MTVVAGRLVKQLSQYNMHHNFSLFSAVANFWDEEIHFN